MSNIEVFTWPGASSIAKCRQYGGNDGQNAPKCKNTFKMAVLGDVYKNNWDLWRQYFVSKKSSFCSRLKNCKLL
jgi:hypothetical protein